MRYILFSQGSTPVDSLGDSWGICAEKPRLPGRGYEYSKLELSSAAAAGLNKQSGCIFPALQMIGNNAGRLEIYAYLNICFAWYELLAVSF